MHLFYVKKIYLSLILEILYVYFFLKKLSPRGEGIFKEKKSVIIQIIKKITTRHAHDHIGTETI